MLSTRGKRLTGILDEPWRFLLERATMFDAASNPSGLISFGTAENPLVYDELTEYVNNNVKFDKSMWSYSYSSVGGEDFRAAMAGHFNRYFDPAVPVKVSEVLATNSVPTLSELLGFTLANAGDGILLSSPVYGRFEVDWGHRPELEAVYADTGAVESLTPAVVKKLEEALIAAEARGVKIRVLIIVNPHNPLGRCYPRETLVEIFRFCQKHELHLISDEIYGLSVFDSGENGTLPFTSTLSIDPKGLIDEKLLHVIYGMSKDFSAPGLRLGCLVTKNPQVQRAIRSTSRQNNPSGVSLAIATAMLNDEKFVTSFLESSRKQLSTSYRFATDHLRKNGIPYLQGANAGCFLWLDLSRYLPPSTLSEPLSQKEREYALAQKLVEGGVFLRPDEEHSRDPGWFRLVFAYDEEMVAEGIKRVGTVVNSVPWMSAEK
ncbi:hypothetical protein FQN49_006523 [Arthroderma sp. PD_2]|nr:hypothetical protein FQN49_006523 [Arthroderma sp. PD_2]